MVEERRRSKRFSVVNLKLFDRETEKEIGSVVNLSEGGLFVHSDEEIDKNRILSLCIPFEREGKEPVNFDIDARVVWCAVDHLEATKFGVGMQFLSDSKEQYEFLKQMIKVYGRSSTGSL